MEQSPVHKLLETCSKLNHSEQIVFYNTTLIGYHDEVNYFNYTLSKNDKVAFATSFLCIAALGVALNLVQIIVICLRIRNHTASKMDPFLISLSIGDIVRSIWCGTVDTFIILNDNDWRVMEPWSNMVCILRTSGVAIGRSNGLYSISIMAVSRLIAVKWPFWLQSYKLPPKYRNLFKILGVLAIVTVLSIPYAKFANSNYLWLFRPDNTYYSKHHELVPKWKPGSKYCTGYARFCTVFHHDNLGSQAFFWFTALLFGVIPSLIVIISYSIILNTLVKVKRQRYKLFATGSAAAAQQQKDCQSIIYALLGFVCIALSLPKLIVIYTEPLRRYQSSLYPIVAVLDILEFSVVITNPVIYTFLSPVFWRDHGSKFKQMCVDCYPYSVWQKFQLTGFKNPVSSLGVSRSQVESTEDPNSEVSDKSQSECMEQNRETTPYNSLNELPNTPHDRCSDQSTDASNTPS